jgi:hypothetical protein
MLARTLLPPLGMHYRTLAMLPLVAALAGLSGCVEQDPNDTVSDAFAHNTNMYLGTSFDGSGTVSDGATDPTDVWVFTPAPGVTGRHQVDVTMDFRTIFAGADASASIQISRCLVGSGLCDQPGAYWEQIASGGYHDVPGCANLTCPTAVPFDVNPAYVYSITISNFRMHCFPSCLPHDPITASYHFHLGPASEREPNGSTAEALSTNSFTMPGAFVGQGQVDCSHGDLKDVWALRPTADAVGPYYVWVNPPQFGAHSAASVTISECQPDGSSCTTLLPTVVVDTFASATVTIRADRTYVIALDSPPSLGTGDCTMPLDYVINAAPVPVPSP